MKRIFITIAIMCGIAGLSDVVASNLTFNGNTLPVITVTPEASTGLNDIYVINAMGGVTMTWHATNGNAQVTWYKYSSLGGGYAEELTNVTHNGADWTLTDIEGDMGYIIEEGTYRYYCWVVDYGIHRFSINALTPGPQQDCSMAELIPSGYGDRIVYYTINGRPEELSREIEVSYTTLDYDKDAEIWREAPTAKSLPYLTEALHVPAPLCDTRYTVTGDRFLRQWGQLSTAESEWVKATAVDAETTATQAKREADNEQSTGLDGLGGSAPAEITFKAVVTDAVVFKEWQMSKTSDFDVVDVRYNDDEFTQIFTERGTTYVRFTAANAAGTCEYVGPTYDVFIGESALTCPNAFSPGASEGVNDEWKVSYKSIVEYECHIFNRWGTKLFSSTDPSKGWDGKYGGKVVPAGVYYYVIKARGADDREYKLSGDINVVNYK